MSARPMFQTSGVAAGVSVVGTTETVVATCGGIATPYGPMTVKLQGTVLLTTGANQTGVKVRIRRASVTGTLVSGADIQTVITAGGDTNGYDQYATDTPGDVTGFVYVLTVQQAGGSNDGASVNATLTARVD